MAGSLRLSDFRSQVRDVSRPNRFWISIVSGIMASRWRDNPHSYLCSSAQIPAKSIGNVNLKWQGIDVGYTGDPKIEPITLTFHNDYDWDIRSYFEDWQNEIADMESNERSAPSEYLAQIRLEQLGRRQGEVIATYLLQNARVTNVSSIDLNQESENQGENFTVTIEFDWFDRV